MFKNILVPIDIEDKYSWKLSIPQALQFVSIYPECKLNIMTAVQSYNLGMMEEYFPKGWVKEVTEKTKIALSKIVEKYIPSEVNTNLIVERGVVYQAIIDCAEKTQVDLIVISAHHPERNDYLLGPNASKVVRHANVSVLVVRGPNN